MAPLRMAARLLAVGIALASSCAFNIQEAANVRFGRRNRVEFVSYSKPFTRVSLSCGLRNEGKHGGKKMPDALPFNRRESLSKSLLVPVLGVVLFYSAPAHATYSAYTHREQDWSERVDHGQVKFSTATSLRKQLREIAPMNNVKSELFCPNGPSSNVSPLMENKCGDRLAMPSVFGRTEDVVGNSIPGFKDSKQYYDDGRARTSADMGSFLDYESVNNMKSRK